MTTNRYPAIIFNDTNSFLEAFFVPQNTDDVDDRKVCAHFTYSEMHKEHTICGKTIPQISHCPICGVKVNMPDITWICKLPFHMQVGDWTTPNYIVSDNVTWDKNNKEADMFNFSVICIDNQRFAFIKRQTNKTIELIFPSLIMTNDMLQIGMHTQAFLDIVDGDLMAAIGQPLGTGIEYFSKLGKLLISTETEYTVNKHIEAYIKFLSQNAKNNSD